MDFCYARQHKRILSNILNNAYEALYDQGTIRINLSCDNDFLKLQIVDDGHGIHSDKIKDVLDGLSLKHPGKGLGLSSAKRYVEKLNGKLTLVSTYKQGTEVTLLFPVSPNPSWLPEAIILPKTSPVIILDDDASIHNLWRHRLLRHDVNAIHFSYRDEFIKWFESNKDTRDLAIYFLDYDLQDDSHTGLDILQQFVPKKGSYLITSQQMK